MINWRRLSLSARAILVGVCFGDGVYALGFHAGAPFVGGVVASLFFYRFDHV